MPLMIRRFTIILILLGSVVSCVCARSMEHSYWVHASLGVNLARGYWTRDARSGKLPSRDEIRKAADLLTGHYGANRLYLVYHKEVPIPVFIRLMHLWKSSCPPNTELIPTLVLRMYSKERPEVFSSVEMERLCRTLVSDLKCRAVGVYDVEPNRDQGAALAVLARWFPNSLIRVGIQPEEALEVPYTSGVQDTWSGLCYGKTNDDWRSPGFGRDTLRRWVEARNEQGKPIAWDLVAVAWDYLPTERGEYPGYDDASRNMPLPDGRNRLAVAEVLSRARPEVLAGFSSDLVILEWNSRRAVRDGPAGSIYSRLRKGEVYDGYFSRPLEEIAAIFREMRLRLPAEAAQ